MNSPSVARQYVWEAFRGVCQECKKDSWSYGEVWQVDHREPLFQAYGELRYWAAENLQLLCDPCHKAKTKTDMDLYRQIADRTNYERPAGKSNSGKYPNEAPRSLPDSTNPDRG